MFVQEVVVDGSAIAKVEHPKRQRRSIAEKRRIVELVPQATLSYLRQHGGWEGDDPQMYGFEAAHLCIIAEALPETFLGEFTCANFVGWQPSRCCWLSVHLPR